MTSESAKPWRASQMGKRTVECSKCDRKFKSEHGLNQHMADYHKQGTRPTREERYPLDFDYCDEYEPRQFSVGCWEEN